MPILLKKKHLEVKDLDSPQRLLDFLDPLQRTLSAALDKGLTLGNFAHLEVTMLLTPPSEWYPLELLNGATPYQNGGFGVPAARWTPWGTEYRGTVSRPQSGTSFSTAFARIPDNAASLRPPTPIAGMPVGASYAPGLVDFGTDGRLFLTAPSTFAANGWVSLHGVRHSNVASGPPMWAVPQERALVSAKGEDLGEPVEVLVLGATRKDRKPVETPLRPHWVTRLEKVGKSMERRLSIQRLDGLEGGITHTVTFLCLYS